MITRDTIPHLGGQDRSWIRLPLNRNRATFNQQNSPVITTTAPPAMTSSAAATVCSTSASDYAHNEYGSWSYIHEYVRTLTTHGRFTVVPCEH